MLKTVDSAMFAQQKENSNLVHYRQRKKLKEKKRMLQKIFILWKNVFYCSFSHKKVYVAIRKTPESNFSFDQRTSLE